MARLVLLLLLACSWPAAAQDSSATARLEQEVRQLQREVAILAQLVNELRMRPDPPPAPVPPLLPAPAAARPAPQAAPDAQMPRWIDAGRWRRVRPGMSELEVIGELGPPTSLRSSDGGSILLYALELGPSAFLAGSVTVRDQAVVAIEMPVLK